MTSIEPSKLKDYAFRLLGRREYSVCELREKLSVKCEDQILVEAVISDFIAHDWVSDERFTEGFIRDQMLKKNGPIKIKFKARKYDLDQDLLEEKLRALYPSEHQISVVKDLGEQKERIIKKRNPRISNFELKGKLTQYLAGKGFGYEIIAQYFE